MGLNEMGSGGKQGETRIQIADGETESGKLAGVTSANELKVKTQDVAITATPGCPTFSKKYRIENDNSQTTLTTSYQTIFTYSGSGKFVGFAVRGDSGLTEIRFKVDGEEIFGDTTNADWASAENTDSGETVHVGGFSAKNDGKLLEFYPICPIVYATSLLIEAKDPGGKKIFQVKMVSTKET